MAVALFALEFQELRFVHEPINEGDDAAGVREDVGPFAERGAVQCSFCGKRSFEISALVEGKGVAICRGCVEDFYQGLP